MMVENVVTILCHFIFMNVISFCHLQPKADIRIFVCTVLRLKHLIDDLLFSLHCFRPEEKCCVIA